MLVFNKSLVAAKYAATALAKRQAGDQTSVIDAGKSVVLCPESADYCANYGNLLVEIGTLASALPQLVRAAAINPASPSIAFNLGNVWFSMDNAHRARDWYSKALCMNPAYPSAYANMGSAMRASGDLGAAAAAYLKASALQPDRAETKWNLATTLLLAGDYENGLRLFEWRKDLPEHLHRKSRPNPWKPQDSIEGKHVVVYAEQGLGDLIQFARFLTEVRRRGASCTLVCPERMQQLLIENDLADRVVADEDYIPDLGGYLTADIMSLPLLLGVSPTRFSIKPKYIVAPEERRKKWRWVRTSGAINVGIAWQGRISPIDRGRSFHVQNFASLTTIPRVKFVSLQRNDGRSQLINSGLQNVIDLPESLDEGGAFLDTAAVISELDLVITSDTAIAHLAGAMGTPVWTALQFVPDWRWGLRTEKNLWYPNMRLYRQQKPGDWDGVFRAIARDLSHQAET